MEPEVEDDSEATRHGKVVGIIYPPPDVRSIVDKTAGFVAKNGRAFEERILRTQGGNQKFSFLKDTDPYHAYYEHKIKQLQKAAEEAKAAAEAAAAAAAAARASRVAARAAHRRCTTRNAHSACR